MNLILFLSFILQKSTNNATLSKTQKLKEILKLTFETKSKTQKLKEILKLTFETKSKKLIYSLPASQSSFVSLRVLHYILRLKEILKLTFETKSKKLIYSLPASQSFGRLRISLRSILQQGQDFTLFNLPSSACESYILRLKEIPKLI